MEDILQKGGLGFSIFKLQPEAYVKRVRSQSQPLWFKILSGFLGLGASLSSAFCVFSLAKLGLFPFPLTIAIGSIIALLTVILVAMQFALTTSISSQVGLSLLTIIVSLVMAAASFFFFQESEKDSSHLTVSSQSHQSSTTLQSEQSSILSSSSFSIEKSLEDAPLDIPVEEPEEDWSAPNPSAPSYPASEDHTDGQVPGTSTPTPTTPTTGTDNGVVVDQPLYVPPADGNDNIYVDEPLYVPPASSTAASSTQASTNSES